MLDLTVRVKCDIRLDARVKGGRVHCCGQCEPSDCEDQWSRFVDGGEREGWGLKSRSIMGHHI